MFPTNTCILIVDDMAGARALLRAQLTGMGYIHILEAENGQDAYMQLEVCEEMKKPVGLIISDWTMPVMNGLEFLDKVKANSKLKNVPFLMVTAEGEITQVVKAIHKGVSDYVVKPFTPDTLFKKIAAVWAKHSRNPA